MANSIQCVTRENHLVAHYALKPPDVPAFHVSGNMLTIHESYSHLAIGKVILLILRTFPDIMLLPALELFASLTIMRHIAQYNL
jgi:hypothetical protein